MRAAIRRVLACVVLLAVLALGLMFAERSFIYYPIREFDGEPTAMGRGFEDVSLVAEDGTRLHGLYLPTPGAAATVLVSHGNAGNISHRVDRALRFQHWLRSNVFLYDYRGFGRSEGRPDEPGTYQDGRAAYRHLVERRGIAPNRLILFGESLGCAVTVELALAHPSAGVVLEAPFTSVPEMSRRVFPFVPQALIRTRYNNLGKIGRLRTPLLILHGDRDSVVPFAMGERLFAAANEPKRFFRITGADHNDTYIVGGEAYGKTLADFVGEYTGPRGPDRPRQ